MPERWERELQKLGEIEPSRRSLGERPEIPPEPIVSGGRGVWPTRLVAVLAGGIALAALWQLLPDGPSTESRNPKAEPALRVSCRDGAAVVATPVVAAQPQGVPIVPIDLPSGWTIGLRSSGDEMITFFLGDEEFEGAAASPLAPGQISVICIPPAPRHREDEIQRLFRERAATFELVDPAAVFTPYLLSCSEPDQRRLYHPVQGRTEREAIAALRESVRGILPTDQVRSVGYPDDRTLPWGWKIVRDGATVAIFKVDEFRGLVVEGLVCTRSRIDPGNPP